MRPAAPVRFPELLADVDQARAYVAALTGSPDTVVTWQTFVDREEWKPAKDLERHVHGSVLELAPWLTQQNRRGAGIFINISLTDLQGRKTQNQIAPRALCVDWDTPVKRAPALPPSFIVHSGTGDHWYWLLVSGEPLEGFVPAQAQLAAFYGSDPRVNLKTQVMRVPGFWHLKRDPKLVTFEPGPALELRSVA